MSLISEFCREKMQNLYVSELKYSLNSLHTVYQAYSSAFKNSADFWHAPGLRPILRVSFCLYDIGLL